jgi:hypothetical protein
MALALARDFTSWLLVLENTINLPERLPGATQISR